MKRRTFINAAMGAGAVGLTAAALPSTVLAQSQSVTENAILNDLDAPVGGNPNGDLTIVIFSDYNCPYCKMAGAALDKVVAEDGNIRLIYKDWPILTKASVFGANLALAAKYQGGYVKVHDALMALPGRAVTEDQMVQAIRASGVDIDQLEKDGKAHANDIIALLKRNNDQALALGLRGTPAYLIGPYLVASALDYDTFKKAVKQAREAEQNKTD